jgi:NTP pyrophosphatase (non-canonical NTP hydrolase)
VDFSEYQKRAKQTDLYLKKEALERASKMLVSKAHSSAVLIAQRSKNANTVGESLGDLLWYLSSVATHFKLDLTAIAERNLENVELRYGGKIANPGFFDNDFPLDEQLPRQMTFKIKELSPDKPKGRVKLLLQLEKGGDHQIGDTVTDNSHRDDGYRYHDAMHLAYMAVLRWSPVIRALMKLKRKSNSETDDVEDGARAINAEEALTEAIFKQAKHHKYFRQSNHVPHDILEIAMTLTDGLEVHVCNAELWKKAILSGFSVFHQVREHKGGYVDVDMNQRLISYRKMD